VTSLTNAAASQRLTGTGESGGTAVKDGKTVGLVLGVESDSVADAVIWVAAAWVDIPARVWAAAVYNALSVAAGCGVEATNGPLQAKIAAARAVIGIRIFLKRLLCIKASGIFLSTPLNASKGV
jgi:hypothetical protein